MILRRQTDQGGFMSLYMYQVAYSPEGWNAVISQPQNRVEAVRGAIEKLGGKVVSGWLSFGVYDVVVIAEMPNHVNAAALGMAFAGGGACKSVNTTPLLTQEEGLQAMKQAGQCGYRPATARAA
jgi:uncharacterized protein with GYD domain